MKTHAIIPVFISHRGCPHRCVFCDQKIITSRTGDVTPDDARDTVERWLTTLRDRDDMTVELAFFGGSFTGIPMDEQKAFLEVAREYKERGDIDSIHMSTRPDCIDERILDNLASYGADVIELGVQSFDEEVLRLSGRGHSAAEVYRASELIKQYGFTLGIQLMIGLPGDTAEKDIYSAKETVKIAPEIARIYPTVVIRGTALHDMYTAGEYVPLEEEDAVERAGAMYEILAGAGINIIRVGLKSSDVMSDEVSFHPAFRQLVEGRIARGRMEEQIERLVLRSGRGGENADAIGPVSAEFRANEKCYGNMFGHKGVNREYFAARYPDVSITYKKDDGLPDNTYMMTVPADESGRK